MSKPLAGTDAERQSALALAAEIDPRRAQVETFWCHPRWPLSQAASVALAVVGSLLAVSHGWLGVALVALALLTTLIGWQFALGPLTGERASQNVVLPAPEDDRVLLVVTASYDTGREGLARRVLPESFGGFGWLAWLVVAMLWTLATVLIRTEGTRSTALGILQLIPTCALLLAAVLLLDLAIASPAGRPRSAPEAAIKLVRALGVAPPEHLRVELVLTGAGSGYGFGLRRYLRARRSEQSAANTVVLGIGDDDDGPVHHLEWDGPLIPLRFFGRLREMAAPIAPPRAGHGCSAALPARMRGLPAITLAGGRTVDRVAAGLLLVDEIDRYVGEIRA